MLRRILSPLLSAGGFALALVLLRPQLQSLPGALTQTLSWLPYAAFAVGTVLGWYFRRSRVAYLGGALALTLWCLEHPSPELTALLALLVPLNLMFLAFFEDRSLDSVSGLLGLAWLMSQVALTQWLMQPLNYAMLGAHRGEMAIFLAAVSTALLLVRYWKIRNPLEWGVLATFGATSLAVLAPYSLFEQRLLLSFSGLALVVSVVRLSYGMAYIDELTELPGRRALNEEMKELGHRYVVAMLDVDHFKQFNDTHGHDVGDQVLRMVASRMKRVGGGGRPFRYGGEEFTVLFPGKDVETTLEALEALRESIANSPLVLRGDNRPQKKPKTPSPQKGPRKSVSVTISIGVAGPGAKQTPEQVLKEADKALYRAKKKGRNCVCH
ncbi:MAG: diguanylate cyclase [Vulcanimicrobiota bacterium]